MPNEDKSAFLDCYKALDAALEDGEGIRLSCATEGLARQLRLRLLTARSLLRKEGDRTYDPLYIKTKEAEGRWWVYVERNIQAIERLSNG